MRKDNKRRMIKVEGYYYTESGIYRRIEKTFKTKWEAKRYCVDKAMIDFGSCEFHLTDLDTNECYLTIRSA